MALSVLCLCLPAFYWMKFGNFFQFLSVDTTGTERVKVNEVSALQVMGKFYEGVQVSHSPRLQTKHKS